MRGPTKRGRAIRIYILRHIRKHPRDVVNVAAQHFGISRQAVKRYMDDLLAEGLITAEGKTRQRRYTLKVLHQEQILVPLAGLEEDQLWRNKVAQALEDLPRNVLDILHYAFTEMVNNAIDHSAGDALFVSVKVNAAYTEISVLDDGIGIFRKIKEECHLEDERHAVLELAKGKLTTDPDNHTGEGIFFTSRMVDEFVILSGDVFFSHRHDDEKDWIMEQDRRGNGTFVGMLLDNDSSRTDQEVFEEFASEADNFGFTKTVVPVRLVRHGVEKLVSRSQAKRLLARVDRFSTVILDFKDVDSIGQAFADEIFRVFVRSNPNVLIVPINTEPQVARMIARAHTNGHALTS